MTKILLVEDQRYPLEALEHAIKKVCSKYLGETSYDVARCYDDAQESIAQQTYDIVLLDHRMPLADVGDLEVTDFRSFSASLQNIGYSLISQIKRKDPTTVVIGTSSLSASELRGYSAPDHVMSKMWGDAERDLDKILSDRSG